MPARSTAGSEGLINCSSKAKTSNLPKERPLSWTNTIKLRSCLRKIWSSRWNKRGLCRSSTKRREPKARSSQRPSRTIRLRASMIKWGLRPLLFLAAPSTPRDAHTPKAGVPTKTDRFPILNCIKVANKTGGRGIRILILLMRKWSSKQLCKTTRTIS